jgi:hypothetical protein
MAFVTPTDVTVGSVLTASRYNADVVENMTAIGGAWTAYTPTWTNLTVGSATQEHAYVAAGKLHVVRIEIALNGSTLSGQPEFTLPGGVSLHSQYSDTAPLGSGFLLDSSSGTGVFAYFCRSSTTAARARLLAVSISGAYTAVAGLSATAPFTWANGDRIEGTFMFQAA